MFQHLVVPVAICAAALAAVAAEAEQLPAYAFEGNSPLVATTGAIDRTYGWDFIPQSDVVVTALGYFDAGNVSPTNDLGDGLFVDHPIAIWDDQQQIVAQTAISAGTPGFTIDNWRYVNIDAVQLEAGRQYTIASYHPEGTFGTAEPFDATPSLANSWFFRLPDGTLDLRPPTLDFSPEVAFVSSRFILSTTPLAFPASTSSSVFGLGAANFLLEPPAAGIPGDTNGDGSVNSTDLLTLLANFGFAVTDGATSGDFDESGTVDSADLLTLLGAFGT